MRKLTKKKLITKLTKEVPDFWVWLMLTMICTFLCVFIYPINKTIESTVVSGILLGFLFFKLDQINDNIKKRNNDNRFN